MNRLLRITVVSLLLMVHYSGRSQMLGTRPVNELFRGLSLEDNLYILNMWGEQPASIQEIYRLAYTLLDERPDATYADLARNEHFLDLCKRHGIIHLGGPMLGDVRSDGARVWVRTLTPGKVTVVVESPEGDISFGPAHSSASSDLTAIVEVHGLKPATRYPYRVYVDDVLIRNSSETQLTTLPDFYEVADARIVVGTCYHRIGIGNQQLAGQIIARNPLAVLLGGDIAVQDRENITAMHRADYMLRDFAPAWQQLAGSIPVYATWDDHDYFNNDKSGIPAGYTASDRASVWNVFRQAWNNPAYGFGENGMGVFFRTRIGPADVIMLDNRFFRTGEKGSFLGPEQMEWLEEQLLDCKGPFIILSCGTMWSDYVSQGKDSWGVNDPDGREQIFQLIEKNKIGGVLLISGDRHGARGFRIPRSSGFSLYEFETASLGGRSGPAVTDPSWDTQLYGFAGIFAFGEFCFNTTNPDPEVTFTLTEESGNELYRITLKRSEITPP